MEQMNQTMEQYLPIYCDYYQDDWSQLLPLVKFVYNNAKNTSTGMSPFYANYRYHSRATWRIHLSEHHENPPAKVYVDRLQQVYNKLWETLKQVQKRYKKKFNKKTAWAPEFKVSNQV